MLGFPSHYLDGACSQFQQNNYPEWCMDAKHNVLGNPFHCVVVARLLSGITPHTSLVSVDDLWNTWLDREVQQVSVGKKLGFTAPRKVVPTSQPTLGQHLPLDGSLQLQSFGAFVHNLTINHQPGGTGRPKKMLVHNLTINHQPGGTGRPKNARFANRGCHCGQRS